MTDRKKFEAWALEHGHGYTFNDRFESVATWDADGLYRVWQASRKQALEEAIAECEKQGDHEQDMGRDKEASGCDLCIDAIRQLASPTGDPA